MFFLGTSEPWRYEIFHNPDQEILPLSPSSVLQFIGEYCNNRLQGLLVKLSTPFFPNSWPKMSNCFLLEGWPENLIVKFSHISFLAHWLDVVHNKTYPKLFYLPFEKERFVLFKKTSGQFVRWIEFFGFPFFVPLFHSATAFIAINTRVLFLRHHKAIPSSFGPRYPFTGSITIYQIY